MVGLRNVFALGSFVWYRGLVILIMVGLLGAIDMSVLYNEVIIDVRYLVFWRDIDAFFVKDCFEWVKHDGFFVVVVAVGRDFGWML